MSLTGHLKVERSPIRQYLYGRFPDSTWPSKEVREQFAKSKTIVPVGTVDWGLLGTAIDFRLRGYFEPVRVTHQVQSGILKLWGPKGPEFQELLTAELAKNAVAFDSVGRRLSPEQESRLCRTCLVLAMFEGFFRAKRVAPQLLDFDPETDEIGKLLAKAPESWVDDLSRQSWAFFDNHADLLSKKAILNPRFAGSADVGGADADLIVDRTLLDIKATKNPRFDPEWLYQLLGYLLLDYSDEFELDTIGFYFSRQALRIDWPLEYVLRESGGLELSALPNLREEFEKISKAWLKQAQAKMDAIAAGKQL